MTKPPAVPSVLPSTPGSSSRWRASTRRIRASAPSRGASSKACREAHASGSSFSCTWNTGAFESDSSSTAIRDEIHTSQWTHFNGVCSSVRIRTENPHLDQDYPRMFVKINALVDREPLILYVDDSRNHSLSSGCEPRGRERDNDAISREIGFPLYENDGPRRATPSQRDREPVDPRSLRASACQDRWSTRWRP
jgi:hypothetical protein